MVKKGSDGKSSAGSSRLPGDKFTRMVEAARLKREERAQTAPADINPNGVSAEQRMQDFVEFARGRRF